MADWLAEAITTGDVERVPANMGAAGEPINDAKRHAHSARSIAESDTTLAIAACHNAIRKAPTADPKIMTVTPSPYGCSHGKERRPGWWRRLPAADVAQEAPARVEVRADAVALSELSDAALHRRLDEIGRATSALAAPRCWWLPTTAQ